MACFVNTTAPTPGAELDVPDGDICNWVARWVDRTAQVQHSAVGTPPSASGSYRGDHSGSPLVKNGTVTAAFDTGKLFDQFLGAAETQAELSEWFLRRFSLLDSLYMVPTLRRSDAPSTTTWVC